MDKRRKPRANALREIAHQSRGQDITRGYIDDIPLLPRVDPPIAEYYSQQALRKQLRDILRDDQVFATFRQRVLSVVARGWTVEPGGDAPADKAAAEFLTEQLMRLDWDRITEQMLYARFYGYAVAEIIWGQNAGRITFDAIKVRDQFRFGFGYENERFVLKLLTHTHPHGETMPDRKFWVVTAGESHGDEPYGQGLAHQLYWPVRFKKKRDEILAHLSRQIRPTAACCQIPARHYRR